MICVEYDKNLSVENSVVFVTKCLIFTTQSMLLLNKVSQH